MEKYIYIIQKEILRTIKDIHRDFKIWCANGETYGYSECYEKVKKEADRLNNENINRIIRYSINEIEELKQCRE